MIRILLTMRGRYKRWPSASCMYCPRSVMVTQSTFDR